MLISGMDCYTQKVTAALGKNKITKKSKNKSPVKVYGYNQHMNTRYSVDSHLDKILVNKEDFRDPAMK